MALGKQWPWNFWYVPWWWHSFRAALTEEFSQTETFIHELQAEPWGPEITKLLSSEEQAKTMNADKLEQIVAFAKNTGMKEIYLWGGEWWYWRFVRYNDTQLWQTVEEIFE